MLFRRKNNTLTPRCFHTDPPPPAPHPPSRGSQVGSGGNQVGTGGGTEWGQVVTEWEPRGNQVGTRWGPGQVGAIGSHSVSTWACLTQGDQSRNQVGEWEASGAKRGPPRGPHWPNYVPTWFTRGPHMGPTWCPIGPHMVPTWSPLSPRGPRLVPARVSANRFTARFSHGSRMVPPVGGVVGASIV